jgi:hypothetical protein
VSLFIGPQLAPDQPKGLGKMMAGGGDKAKRLALDYYPTPPEATRAFLMAEGAYIRAALDAQGRDPQMWEPCGRGGAINAVFMQEMRFRMIASDVVADPRNGVRALDLLAAQRALAPIVITNPPFALWRPMLVRLLVHLKCDYVAFLLKASAMNSEASAKLAEQGLSPTGRWDICWRLDFTGGGNSTMDCSWFVWDMRERAMRGGPLRRAGPVTRLDQSGTLI